MMIVTAQKAVASNPVVAEAALWDSGVFALLEEPAYLQWMLLLALPPAVSSLLSVG
jgi:hypothetical protein